MVEMKSLVLRTAAILMLISEGNCCGNVRDDWETMYQQKCTAAEKDRWKRLTEKETQLTENEVEYREYQYEVRLNMSRDHEPGQEGCERKRKFILTTEEPAALSLNFANRYDNMKKAAIKDNTVCVNGKCYSSLSSVNEAMKTMKDRDERLSWWLAARNAVGQSKREYFQMLTTFLNEMAAENGFDNMAEQWESYYDEEMWKEAERLWKELKPLYEVLHAWVRMKLNNGTGGSTAIPAHLLGDLYGQDWSSILPYSFLLESNSKDAMEVIWESLLSAGITGSPPTFLSEGSFREDPDCKPLVTGYCSADMISLVVCEGASLSHYAQLSSQIGQYIWLKETKDLDFTYRQIRKSASPDLYVGLTQAFKLIAGSSKQWKKIGKLQRREALITDVGDMDDDMKVLLQIALMTFGSLTYHLSMSAWRRNVLMGKGEVNIEWWKARLLYQGVEAPTDVETNKHFDAFHPNAFLIHDNFRYFFGEILAFQLSHSLCNNTTKDEEPYTCNPSKKMTKKFRMAMKAGSSRRFQEIVDSSTGRKYRDITGILEYFHSLKQHLSHELKSAGEPIGWPVLHSGMTTTDILVIGSIMAVLLLLISIWFFVGRRSSRVLEVSS